MDVDGGLMRETYLCEHRRLEEVGPGGKKSNGSLEVLLLNNRVTFDYLHVLASSSWTVHYVSVGGGGVGGGVGYSRDGAGNK